MNERYLNNKSSIRHLELTDTLYQQHEPPAQAAVRVRSIEEVMQNFKKNVGSGTISTAGTKGLVDQKKVIATAREYAAGRQKAYNKLQMYSMLSSDNFHDIESYEEADVIGFTEQELDRNLEDKILKEIEAQRVNIETKIGRSLSSTEWEKVKQHLQEESSQRAKGLNLPKKIKVRKESDAVKRMTDAYKADRVIKSGYIMGPNGPKRAFGLVKKDGKWLSGFDAHTKKSEHLLLTDAGGLEWESVNQKLHQFREDADILRAMRADVYDAANKGSEEIHFKNTYEAMKLTSRHSDFAKRMQLGTRAYEQYDAYEVVDRFMTEHMAAKYNMSPKVLTGKKQTYLFRLAANISRARENVNQVFFRKDTRNYTPGQREQKTAFGQLQERARGLKEIRDFTQQAYRELQEEERQTGPGMEEGAGDDILTQYDKDREAEARGDKLSRSRDDARQLQEDREWREHQAEMDKALEAKSGPRDPETGRIKWDEAYHRPITPQEAFRRAAEEVMQPLSDEKQQNMREWEAQLQSNPRQLLVKQGDLAPRMPIPDENGLYVNHMGDIKTIREHILVPKAGIKVKMRAADRGVEDMGGRLQEAMKQIEESRLSTDVARLLPEPSGKMEFRLAGEIKQEVEKYGRENNVSSYLKANAMGHVTLDRQELKKAMMGEFFSKNGTINTPKWLEDTLADRAPWLLTNANRKELPSMFMGALDNVVKTGFDFELLEKDKHFQDRLSRLKNVEDPLLKRYIAATNRDVLYGIMNQALEDSSNNLDHLMLSTIWEWQRRNSSTAMPSLAQMEEMVADIHEDMQAHGYDNMASSREYLRQNWRELKELAMKKPDWYVNGFERPDSIALRGADEDDEDFKDKDRALEVEDGAYVDDEIANAHEKKLSDLREEVQAAERKENERAIKGMEETLQSVWGDIAKTGVNPGSPPDAAAAELMIRLRDTLPEEIDGKKNKARKFRNLANFYYENEKSGVLAQLLGNHDVTLSLNDANHARQLAAFTDYGFKFDVVEVNGKARGGSIEKGKNDEVFWRDERNVPVSLVDTRDEAIEMMSARGKFDTDLIRTMPMDDYRPLQAPKGHVPVLLDELNIRETSRLGKGKYMPQTMAESLQNMDAIRKGRRVVAMDVETTLLPTGSADRQHLLETSLREYKWQNGELVPGRAEQLFLKPDDAMRQQVEQIAKRDVGEKVAGILRRGGSEAEKMKAFEALEEVSYLRNLAKYAGTDTAAASSSFSNPPAVKDWAGYLQTLRKDARTALDVLDKRGTHTLPEMLNRINKFVSKSIVLAQNGGSAEKVWMDILRDRVNITPEQFIERQMKDAPVNSRKAEFLEGLPQIAQGLEDGRLSRADFRSQYGPELTDITDEYMRIRDGKHLVDEFKPKMVDLIHASRNYQDLPGMSHSMASQVERMYASGKLHEADYQLYKDMAHFADVDTDLTAKIFERYMGDFEGYKPKFLKEGTMVAKVRGTSGGVNRGIYTVDHWEQETNTLHLLDDKGNNVRYAVNGANELSALFQTDFIVPPKGANPMEFLKEAQDTLDFDRARADVSESNSYMKFMNNRIKNKAAAAGNVDGRGYTTNTMIDDLKKRDYDTKSPSLINVTETERLAAPHSAAYWSSPEADLKQQAFGQLKDMMDLGHIDQSRADEIMDEVDKAFAQIGKESNHERGTVVMQGYIDAGELIRERGGKRLVLAARSENELMNSLWNATGDMTKLIKDEGVTEDERRIRAIRDMLIPHLADQGMYPRYEGPARTGGLDPSERLQSIAKTLHQNSRKDGQMPVANVEGLKPIITDVNRDQAEKVMRSIFQKEVDNMGPATRRAYMAAGYIRDDLEGTHGSLVPYDVSLARIANEEASTLSVNTRWNTAFKGKTVDEIASYLTPRTQEALQYRDDALRELNSILHANNPESEAAARALGRAPVYGPMPAHATVAERFADLSEAIMPIGSYKGTKLKDIPQDFVDDMLYVNDDELYDSQRQILNEYQGYVQKQTSVLDGALAESELPINAAQAPVDRATMIESATERAFKQAEEKFSRDPSEFIEIGRSSKMIDAGLENVGNSMKGLFKGSGKLKAAGVVGLALAGTFILGNFVSDPGTWKRPNGDTPNADGDYLDAPKMDAPQAPARVEEHGSGLDGMRIRVKGRAPGHMSNEQVGAMVGESVRGGVNHETNVKVSSRDDTTKVNNDWLKQTYTEYMKNGYVNG